MSEVRKIRTKKDIGSAVFLAAAAYVAVSALVFPARTAESVSSALLLSVRAVVPALFPFVMAYRIMSPRLVAIFSKTKAAGRFFGVGAGGLCMMMSGLLSGFPTAAVMYSELEKIGAIDENEGESLMPFCSGAGAAFLIGAVGDKMFGDALFGVRLLACQTAAALILIFATRRSRRPSPPISRKNTRITPSHAARAVFDTGMTMIGVSSFIAAFSVLSDALAADLRLDGFFDGVVRSALEISGGLAALSRIGGAGRYLAGFAVGFAGFSVFLQCHFASRGAAMKKYVSGKILMSAVTGALFAATEFFRAAPVFFEIFGERASAAKDTAKFFFTIIAIALPCVFIAAFVLFKAQKAKNK